MPLKMDDLKTVEKYKSAIKQDAGKINAEGKTRFWIYKDVELSTAKGDKQKLPVVISLVDDVAIKAFLKGKPPLCLGTCGLTQGNIVFAASQGAPPYAILKQSVPTLLGKPVHVPDAAPVAPPRPSVPPPPLAGTQSPVPLPPPPTRPVPLTPPEAKKAAEAKAAAQAEALRLDQEAKQKAAAEQAEKERQLAEEKQRREAEAKARVHEFRDTALPEIKKLLDFGDPLDRNFNAQALYDHLQRIDQHIQRGFSIFGGQWNSLFHLFKVQLSTVVTMISMRRTVAAESEGKIDKAKAKLAETMDDIRHALAKIEAF